MKKIQKLSLQVGFLFLVSLAGNWLAGKLHLPIPGNVLALLLMLLLLELKVVRLDWVDAGAGWLLGEMLLFFIPAAVGIIQYKQLILTSGVRILLVIGLSTLAVMACTGLAAEALGRWRKEGEPNG